MKRFFSSILILLFGISIFSQDLLEGLTFHAPFDDAVGTTYIETYPTTSNWISGPVGTVTLESPGKLGTSFLFNGADYIITQEQAGIQMGTSDFSMFMWIRPTSYYNQQDSSNMYMIGGETGAATFGMEIGTGYLKLVQRNVTEAPASDLVPVKNQWNLVGVRFLSGLTTNNLIYYLNGEEDTVTHNADFTEGASSYVIGQSDVGVRPTDFMGYIDEFSIWKRALSAAEVALLYNSGDGLAYPFSEPVVYTNIQQVQMPGNNLKIVEMPGGNKKAYYVYIMPIPEPPIDETFTVLYSWDFEQEDIGFYSDSEVREDFDARVLYSHASANIVVDEINNVETKVLRITHEAGVVSHGFEMFAELGTEYDELYISFNMKFSKNFNSTRGGKIPGLRGFPGFTANQCPTYYQGFTSIGLFKRAGFITTYHYDKTRNYCAWSADQFPTQYETDTIYMNYGQWYNITKRVRMNSFTGGVANADGINETWINGRLVTREADIKYMTFEHDTMKIDGFNISNFYGGGANDGYEPVTECYGYFDNFVIYHPENDPTFGYALTHDPVDTLRTPVEITDRDIVYDQLITTAGTLSNSQYGNYYSSCIDEAYLIDAGAGNTVSYTANWLLGGYDYLFFYDGNTSDANLIRVVRGYNSSTNQTITSTGRYMFVRFNTDHDGSPSPSTSAGFTGTITFN